MKHRHVLLEILLFTGEEINRAKNTNAFANKKPHGILKNKIEDQSKKGDTTGYIKRNTVQKILEQQKSVS